VNLDLKELGITFIVGAFTILGFEAILYNFFNIQLTGFFHGKLGLKRGKSVRVDKADEVKTANKQLKEESTVQSMKAAVFIGIAFGVGILAEDLSYKYVDNVQTPFRSLPSGLNSILPDELNKQLGLPSKESSRIKTLISNFDTEKPEVQPLAVELASNKAFATLYYDPDKKLDTGERLDKWILRVNQCKVSKSAYCDANQIPESKCTWYDDSCPLLDKDSPSKEDVKESIYGLYYYAKNRAYLIPTYYDEMRRIETRRDFSRSIALIAYVYVIGAFVLGLIRTAYILRKYTSSRHKINRRHEIYRRILPVWLILFCIYFFSMWAYERESSEFNKRAFGYFSAMLIKEKTLTSAKEKGRTDLTSTDSSDPMP